MHSVQYSCHKIKDIQLSSLQQLILHSQQQLSNQDDETTNGHGVPPRPPAHLSNTSRSEISLKAWPRHLPQTVARVAQFTAQQNEAGEFKAWH